MAKLQIIVGENNPILRAKSVEVREFGKSLKKFVKRMKETMLGANGLGIAAPQVGENIRVFIVTFDYNEPGEKIIAMVNPVILEHSEETELGEEGCLSLPGIYEKVECWRRVKVGFQGVDGGRQVLELEGLNARVVQHELDHLNGILFIDRVKGKKKGEKEGDLVM